MAEEVRHMHEDFARWHAAIGIGDDQLRRHARWAGVSTIVEAADTQIVEALVRLAFRTRQTAVPASLQKIRQAFKDADETFEMQGNDREVQVLSGTCLAVLMELQDAVAARAALSVTTAALGGARKADVPMDLLELAENAINRIADANRERPNLASSVSGNAPKCDFQKAAAKIRETPGWESVAEAFSLAAEATNTAMRTIVQRQATTMQAFNRFVLMQDEELQMLWWLTGQRSWDHDCSFEALAADLQPLAFSKELADNTEFLPGPPSIKALLSRAGLKERKKVVIPQVINAADSMWLQRVLGEGDPSPVSTPLHCAIKRQLETGAGDAWIAGWSAVTGIDSTHSISPLALGTLFYRERLLILFE
jgi:hypothetical protein